MQLETILCEFGRICATGNALMQLETILCKVWTNLCDRKCSYAAGNDFMRVWTNLCYRECFSVTNCWQELHFEISRQNLNRNVQNISVQ